MAFSGSRTNNEAICRSVAVRATEALATRGLPRCDSCEDTDHVESAYHHAGRPHPIETFLVLLRHEHRLLPGPVRYSCSLGVGASNRTFPMSSIATGTSHRQDTRTRRPYSRYFLAQPTADGGSCGRPALSRRTTRDLRSTRLLFQACRPARPSRQRRASQSSDIQHVAHVRSDVIWRNRRGNQPSDLGPSGGTTRRRTCDERKLFDSGPTSGSVAPGIRAAESRLAAQYTGAASRRRRASCQK